MRKVSAANIWRKYFLLCFTIFLPESFVWAKKNGGNYFLFDNFFLEILMMNFWLGWSLFVLLSRSTILNFPLSIQINSSLKLNRNYTFRISQSRSLISVYWSPKNTEISLHSSNLRSRSLIFRKISVFFAL